MAEPRRIKAAGRAADSRLKLMRAIRAACQRHGMNNDARRDMQVGLVERGLIGNASMADMTLAELGRLLDELNRDWSGPAGHRAHVGKIRALWWTLYWLGAVHAADQRAIDAFVRRQTGVSALRFLDHRPAASVVEALKAWAAREGVDWPGAPDAIGDRRAVFDALCARLDPDVLATALAGGSLALPADRWQRHELDAAIRCLGKAWRRKSGAVAR